MAWVGCLLTPRVPSSESDSNKSTEFHCSLETDSRIYQSPCRKVNPYAIHAGYRIVLPYKHVYRCFVKERWIGRKVSEVLSLEFAALDKEYIKYACTSGKIRIENRKGVNLYPHTPHAVLNHTLAQNERLVHHVVVHEQLALDNFVRVLDDDEHYIVVSKPCGIPVYHTGTFFFNTLIEWLRYQHPGINGELLPLFRIDKLVSGIVAFAKDPPTASRFNLELASGNIKKVYIARVMGDFSKLVVSRQNILELGDGSQVLNLRGYMRTISVKLGIHEFISRRTYQNVKEANTRFRMVAYNPDMNESLVLCYPVTGRTHQIRAHLMHLGYPISNDANYNSNPLVTETIPTTQWQINADGHWCLPEIDYVHPEPLDVSFDAFHIGLKRSSKDSDSPTGIFLHAYRYIWPQVFDVVDQQPQWVEDFEIAHDLSTLNLW
ncbi:bifunctional Pseudouridine synthase [Babesia duncani]|uniref:Bifunctional Pseudouridine synthase n=1 Tax=Babesia duncani TaxID=323732 RepID=A0AAD9PPA3_9APIC|nr:bifunctional Pseudouridine synthase [Babesia duncani]